MIISMKLNASRAEIDHVCERIQEFGFRVHSIAGEQRVVIGVVGVGGDVSACLESLEATPGVESAMRISAPYKFVSREFRKEKTVITVGKAAIGGGEFITMAGPCSVENEKQIMETAEAVAAAGATVLRGGAFKPRTSPYDFQGMEGEGLKLLAKAREATGLAIITEVMSDSDVGLVAQYADVLQIGEMPVPEPGHVILVRQYRHAVNAKLWELPAGSLDGLRIVGLHGRPRGDERLRLLRRHVLPGHHQLDGPRRAAGAARRLVQALARLVERLAQAVSVDHAAPSAHTTPAWRPVPRPSRR